MCCGGLCMFDGLNFKLYFWRNGTGLSEKILTWCRTWTKFYEFHYPCAWKIALHTWEDDELPRSLVLETSLSLRELMIMWQLGQTNGQDFAKTASWISRIFWTFSSEDLDFTNFSFDFLEIIQCIVIKRETMTKITCKSYSTYSIIFQGDFYTVNTTCRNQINFMSFWTFTPAS